MAHTHTGTHSTDALSPSLSLAHDSISVTRTGPRQERLRRQEKIDAVERLQRIEEYKTRQATSVRHIEE